MNLHDSYYERIIYKKGAISELSAILDKNFKHKKVFFLSGKAAYQKFGSVVVNQLNRAGSEFVFKFVDNEYDKQQLDSLVGEALTCKVIVGLGGGTSADCAKYIAKQTGLKYILIASCPTTIAYFTPYSFLQNNLLYEEIKYEPAFKVIIDENFIIHASEDNILSGKQFLTCFWEVLLNMEINNLLFEKKQNTTDIKLHLAKITDHISQIDFSGEGKLLLMDLLVDMGYVVKDLDLSSASSVQLAMLLKTSGAIKTKCFGVLCQTATKMLFESYKKFFSLKKIDIYSFLDLESLASNLTVFKVKAENIDLQTIKNIRQNKQMFLKLNAIKNQVLCLIVSYFQQIDALSVKKEQAKIDMPKCLMSFHILPYVYPCSPLTNILSSSGLITC